MLLSYILFHVFQELGGDDDRAHVHYDEGAHLVREVKGSYLERVQKHSFREISPAMSAYLSFTVLNLI